MIAVTNNFSQLHMWMVMMRLKNHHLPLHKDFKFLVYHLNKSMWADLEKRAGKLAQAAIRKESLTILGENYKGGFRLLITRYTELPTDGKGYIPMFLCSSKQLVFNKIFCCFHLTAHFLVWLCFSL